MVPQMLAAGARIVGGCCGTTPTTRGRCGRRSTPSTRTGAAPSTWRNLRPDRRDEAGNRVRDASDAGADPAAAAAPRTPRIEVGRERRRRSAPTGLARKLAAARFVVVGGDRPAALNPDRRTVEAASLLKEAGVDLVNVSDSATGRVRMGAWRSRSASSSADLECLVHLTTRDRNLMALETELLGAHALGLRNILALTGDPPRVADRPAATAVWDVDRSG